VSLLERARSLILAADGVGVDLKSLAAEVGLSRFHLLRLYKAAYGVTPLGFAEQTRMDAAERRLAASRRPVGEVAAQLGYESPSAFARAFRRHRGQSPAAFQAGVAN
jgi:AraC-like DNA-binding protein